MTPQPETYPTSERHMTKNEALRTRSLYLYTSAVALLVLGLIYAWSIFASPIAAEYGWEKGALQTTFNIAMICFCLAGLAGSYVNKLLSTRATIILSGALMMVGFLGTALFADKSLWGMYVSYGVFCGAGCGMGYIMIISVVNSWFSDKIGFASGIMMMGMGLGSLVLGTLASTLIEATNIKLVFVILAVVAFVVPSALALLIRKAPSYINELIVPTGAAGADESAYEDDNILKLPAFYVYLIWAVFVIAVGLTLIGGSKQGAAVLGIEGIMSTLIVGLVSTMNGLARPFFGTLYDKTSLKTVMFTSGILSLVAAILIAFSYASSTGISYIIAALMMGLGYGGIPVIASAFARERFGAKNYARNLGVINLSAAIGSFLSIGLVAFLSPDGSSTNAQIWVLVSVVAAIAVVGAILFSFMYKKPGK